MGPLVGPKQKAVTTTATLRANGQKKKKLTKRHGTPQTTPEAFAERLEQCEAHEGRLALIAEAARLGKKFLQSVSHNVCVPLPTSKTIQEGVRALEVRSQAGPFKVKRLFPDSGHFVWAPKPVADLLPDRAKGPQALKPSNMGKQVCHVLFGKGRVGYVSGCKK